MGAAIEMVDACIERGTNGANINCGGHAMILVAKHTEKSGAAGGHTGHDDDDDGEGERAGANFTRSSTADRSHTGKCLTIGRKSCSVPFLFCMFRRR